MAKGKTEHQTYAQTGSVPGVGSIRSTASRFSEGGYTKHKQTTHRDHGALLGFKQMPHAADSHEQRCHQKGGSKKD